MVAGSRGDFLVADTLVEGGANGDANVIGIWGPYWTSTTVGVIVYVNSSSEVEFMKTSDGGANWSSTETASNGSTRALSVWFQQQTPGLTGDTLHCVWLDDAGAGAGIFEYVEYDISSATIGTIRTVVGSLSVSGTVLSNRSYVGIAKGGQVYCGYAINGVSSDSFDSADGITFATTNTVWESSVNDICLFFPATGTGDDDDCGVVFWDLSANDLTTKMFDASADSWDEDAIGSATDANFPSGMALSVRLSDEHVILAAWNSVDDAGADIDVYDITPNSVTAPTISALTDAVVDSAESYFVGVFIDQSNNDLYVAYASGTAYLSLLSTKYVKSDDDGTTWGSPVAYQEDAEDDIRWVNGGAMGPDTQGGRFQPMFFNDDLNDIYVNLTNDIEIAAAAGATGTAAATFPSLSASATGVMQPAGTAAATFPSLSATATGVMHAAGAAAATLPSLTAAATGTQTQTGTAAATFPSLTASATGAMNPSGTAAATFPSLSASATGVMQPSGTAAPTFPSLVAVLLGAVALKLDASLQAGTARADALGAGSASSVGLGSGSAVASTLGSGSASAGGLGSGSAQSAQLGAGTVGR